MPDTPDQPPVQIGPPAPPRALGVLHTLARVICVCMLIFDGLLAMGIISTAAAMVQFKADPQAVLKALPPVYSEMSRAGVMQYFIPLSGWWLIGQVGSLLLVFGVIGFLQYKRWCIHPLILCFGIHFVNLIVLSFALGPMTVALTAGTAQAMTPEQANVGAVIFTIFSLFLYAIFRGIPALILRASIKARWEEEFN